MSWVTIIYYMIYIYAFFFWFKVEVGLPEIFFYNFISIHLNCFFVQVLYNAVVVNNKLTLIPPAYFWKWKAAVDGTPVSHKCA